MALEKKDIWTKIIEPLLLEQYKSSENLKGIIKAFCDQLTALNDTIVDFGRILDLENGTSTALDFIGGIFNLPRRVGESDTEYKSRLKHYVSSKNNGTPERIMLDVAELSGDDKPRFIEECPATFLVYTPKKGKQLTREQVKKLSPAGVLGLPAAAIQLGNGKSLVTESSFDFEKNTFKPKNERTLLVVAGQDVPHGQKIDVEERLESLVTEDYQFLQRE